MTAPRAVVAGGAGFVGSHLCDRLLQEGWEVVCVDSLLTGARVNLSEAAAESRFSIHEADITEGLDVEGPVDWIFNLASPASPVDYLAHPIETLEVGALGSLACLRLAERKGAGLFLASTSEVYGDPQVHPQPESYWGNVNPIGPRSVYDEAKRFAEAVTMAFHRTRGVPVRIIRSSTPTVRGCDATTAEPFRRSSTRPSAPNRSPSMETAPRPGRSATSTISSKGSAIPPLRFDRPHESRQYRRGDDGGARRADPFAHGRPLSDRLHGPSGGRPRESSA